MAVLSGGLVARRQRHLGWCPSCAPCWPMWHRRFRKLLAPINQSKEQLLCIRPFREPSWAKNPHCPQLFEGCNFVCSPHKSKGNSKNNMGRFPIHCVVYTLLWEHPNPPLRTGAASARAAWASHRGNHHSSILQRLLFPCAKPQVCCCWGLVVWGSLLCSFKGQKEQGNQPF